jgi:putative CocE/NonD family hydrolase
MLRAAAVVLLAVAPAQPPDPGHYSPERYAIDASRGHRVTVRDGVSLSVDVYRPAAEGRFPAVLTITPYDNNAGWTVRARWFAQRGYAVVLADSRGRYDSDGVWDPFDRRHKTDGYDLAEWAAKQPWCTGKVGMIGPSYMAWTQWWAAVEAPPSLAAIVPEVAPPDAFANAPYQQGVLVGWMMDWAAGMSGRTAQSQGPGPYGGFAATRDRDYLRLPYIDLNRRRGALDAPWFDGWLRDNTARAPYWKAIAYQTPEHYARVTVPSLNVTGWFDANHPGSPMNYRGVKQHGATPAARRPHLVIGPWPHSFNRSTVQAGIDYGPASMIDWDGYACRWLDHWLKGEANGVENEPPVHVFVMNRNRWRAAADYPLPGTQFTKYFLHTGGTLSTEPPTADEPADRYTYDPAKPTRCPPFANGHIDGARDTRPTSGDDVLVYTTPPLTEEVEVVGPVEAKLYAATSARDTDWMVRLADVQPDGRALFLCDGVIRARGRDPRNAGRFTAEGFSEVQPGKVLEYTVEFWRGTGVAFGKGHRIRVEVSSAFFPYYLPNPNSGDDNIALAASRVTARQEVHHTKARPSHVVLPVIPAH